MREMRKKLLPKLPYLPTLPNLPQPINLGLMQEI